jgi:hypothetical protein
MRRVLPFTFAAYLTCLSLVSTSTLFAQNLTAPERGGLDWIFVIDTSASMRGAGGTQDIFDAVKRAVGEFIATAKPGDSVTIYSFDRDTQTRPTVRIADDTDKRDLMSTIVGIEAEGQRTHTGKALSDALARARELGARDDAKTRKVGIVLLTDGLEDVRGIANAVPIPETVELIPDNEPFMFFVSLGQQKETAIEEAFRNNPKLGGFHTVEKPSREELQKLAERLRPVLEAAAKPKPEPIRITVQVVPSTVDFGEAEPGDESDKRSIEATSSHDARVHLSLAEPGEINVAPTDPVELKASEPARIDVRLTIPEHVQEGPRALKLLLRPVAVPSDALVTAGALDVHVLVARQPLWLKALWWLGVVLVPLVLIVGCYSVVKGRAPWTMWRNWREQNHLEGEIEIIRPRPAPGDDTHVSLASLRTERVAISAIIPAVAARDSDGELFTEFRRGTKHVRFRRTRGTARLNGTDASVADLHDGHLIEVGEARIRFHWLGHEEPLAVEPDDQ